jgi:hypothetical protein
MSELKTAPAETQNVVEEPEQVIEAVSHPPVLITEQAVAFSTAAAMPLPRTKPTRGVIAALRARFRSPSEDEGDVPRHYPPRREEFLEDAAMEREMHRL